MAGYLKAIWPDLFGCVFEVWPSPGALFGMVFGAAGAAQTPKSKISGRPQNHVSKTQV